MIKICLLSFLGCLLSFSISAQAEPLVCGIESYRLRLTRHPLSSFSFQERRRFWKEMSEGRLETWEEKLLKSGEKKAEKRLLEAADQWRALGFLRSSSILYKRLALRYHRADGIFFLAKDALRERKVEKAKRLLVQLEKLSMRQRKWRPFVFLLWGRWGQEHASSAWMYKLYQKSKKEASWLREFLLRLWTQKTFQDLRLKKRVEDVFFVVKRLKKELISIENKIFFERMIPRILMLGGKKGLKEVCRAYIQQKKRQDGPRLRLRLAECAASRGEQKKASSIYFSILQRWPGTLGAEKARRVLVRKAFKQRSPLWYVAIAKHFFLRMDDKKADLALQKISAWIKKNKKYSSELFYLWSRIAFRQKEYDRCISFFSWKEEASRPLRSLLQKKRYLLWIRCRYRKKKSVEEVKLYEDFFTKTPKSKEGRQALWWAAQLYAEHKKEKKAKSLFLRYIREVGKSGRSKEALFKLGLVSYQKKDYKEAMYFFQKLLRLGRAEAAKGLYWLGKSSEKQGKKRRAQDFFRRAMQKGHGYYSIEASKKLKIRRAGNHSPLALIWHDKEEEQELRSVFLWSKRYNKGVQGLCRRLRESEHLRQAILFRLTGWDKAFLRAMTKVKKQLPGSGGAYLLARTWRFLGRADRVLKEGGRARVLMSSKEKRHFPSEIWMRMLFPVAYPGLYLLYGKKYKIPALFMMGLTRQESLFSPTIISGAGARGIAQMMPKDAAKIAQKMGLKNYRLSDLFRPEINLRMGFYHFRDYLDRYQDQKDLTLAAYNAGPHTLKRWLKEHPGLAERDRAAFLAYGIGYRETRQYVPSCLRWYRTYRFYMRPSKVF